MLKSKRVLDLTWVLGGPFAGQLLAQLGAEVIKVETPEGDPSRTIPPYYFEGDSTFFLSANTGKKSIALDLKTPEGKEAFYDLVRVSDVVIYGFAPDVPKRLGIDYESLRKINPDIRVGELIGLHDEEPFSRAPAYDIIVQALSGLMDITGSPDGPPSRVGYQIADLAGGLYLALGVCGALVESAADDEAKYFQISLLDCQLALLNWQAQNYLFSDAQPTRLGSRSPNIAPSEAFRCQDGRYLAVSPTGTHFWDAFCAAVEQPGLARDPRFASRQARLDHVGELADVLGEILLTKSSHDWANLFFENRIPAARVLTVAEALDQPVARMRSMVETLHHPVSGNPVRVLGNPFKYEGSSKLRYPSSHGADTREVLSNLCGYTPNRLDHLAEANAITGEDSHDMAN